jgi:hypothetical protein
MTPATETRTASDPVSGAVSGTADPESAPRLSGADFWRAVVVEVLATLWPWLR